LTAPSAAPSVVGGGTDAPTPKTYFEQGILVRSGEVIEALGPNLMGDSINEYSGALEFTQMDVSLPGNNALRLRSASSRRRRTSDQRRRPVRRLGLGDPAPARRRDTGRTELVRRRKQDEFQPL
jgi:hypothetical protein